MNNFLAWTSLEWHYFMQNRNDDIEGVVEFLAKMAARHYDPTFVRGMGIICTIILAQLIVHYGIKFFKRKFIYTIKQPEEGKTLWYYLCKWWNREEE